MYKLSSPRLGRRVTGTIALLTAIVLAGCKAEFVQRAGNRYRKMFAPE